MADRKNLKISESTYNYLRDKKPEQATWNGFFHRVFQDAEDPRPRFPTISRGDEEEPTWYIDEDEKRELSKKARELQEEINFKRILQESEDVVGAKEALLAELMADRDLNEMDAVETTAPQSDNISPAVADTIAQRTADRVVEKLEQEGYNG